jgi:hypothetical protein
MKPQTKFPPGWDQERVRRVLKHYEEQSDDEALAEDEAAFESTTHTVMEVPVELVSRGTGVAGQASGRVRARFAMCPRPWRGFGPRQAA